MSSLLKKFTSDAGNSRTEDLNTYARPRDFVPPVAPISRAPESNRTNLCADVELKGSLTFKDYLRLDGKFEGEIHSAGTFIVGENGVVKADIQVGNLIVEGKIHGNVIVQDKIELRPTAQLFGDIKASRLVISEGVVFVGRSDVNPSQKIEKLTPSASAPANDLLSESEQSPAARDTLY